MTQRRLRLLSCLIATLLLPACGGGGGTTSPDGGSTPDGGSATPDGSATLDSGATPDGSATPDGGAADGGPVHLASQAIGPAGGTIAVPGLTLAFPAGALSATTVITIDAAPDAPMGIPGRTFECGPSGTQFAQPVLAHFTYATLPAGVTADRLRIFTRQLPGDPLTQLATTLDSGGGGATANLMHFSLPNLGALPAASGMASAAMSFFVTSTGKGSGDLGGLAGADAYCAQLVNASPVVPAAVKARTWVAYLSTTPVVGGATTGVDARERIYPPGTSFSYADFNGAAVNPTALGGIPTAQILDEKGQPVPDLERDILTGSRDDGTADPAAYGYAQSFGFTAGNCVNWTSPNAFSRAYVGHADFSLASSPTAGAVKSFSTSHYRNCDLNGYNSEAKGAGRIYCFGH